MGMKFKAKFFQSKVGRRIFTLFVLCALIPITALAILGFTQVTKQLYNQCQEQLRREAKAVENGIRERLFIIEAHMKMVASSISLSSQTSLQLNSEEINSHLEMHLKGLLLITETGKDVPLYGQIQDPPELTPDEKKYLLSEEFLISTQYRPRKSTRIFMITAVEPKHKQGKYLLGEIIPEYLWHMGGEPKSPLKTELFILDSSNQILYSSLMTLESLPEKTKALMSSASRGDLEWAYEKEEYLASHRTISLKNIYSTPDWTVVVNKSKAHILEPMTIFKQIFLFVALMSLWIVLLLSVSQIRRSLVPLQRLKEGTQRIAKRDFDSRVTVKSRDEFADLATSFNSMASQLARQFRALLTIDEIDRAILSVLNKEKIVDTVLTRMRDVFPCKSISTTLLASNPAEKAETYVSRATAELGKEVATVKISPEDIQKLQSNPETLSVELSGEPPNYLLPLARRGNKSFLVLPIFLKKKLTGIITLGYAKKPVFTQEELDQARQLADQVAVALSNAQLIEELNNLNWGTLTALARAIDAKSPWTAGHSERVTKLAVEIGQAMGLSQEEIDNLHRGGLLHDIGKLGIPPEILDKPGHLTSAEQEFMHKHVRVGVRILEPIAAYAEVIPILRHHHERFDGSGYPDGLSGEDISLGGRIYAVADDHDALNSDRPYRKAMGRKRTVEFIKRGAGSRYDPKVVEAFLKVMEQGKRERK